MLFASSNSHRLVLFAVIYYLLSLNGIYALPLHRRQNNGATTVTTTRTTQTNAGPVTETCEITLTPITDKDGKPAVEEVKKCTLALANGGTAAGSSTTFISTATATSAASTSTDTITLTSATATSTSTDTATKSDTASPSLTTTVATSTPSGGSTVTATTSQATSTGSGTSSAVPGVSSGKAGAIIANGISTVSRSAAATGTTPAATTTSPTQPEATGGTPSDSNNNPNGTSAADSTVSASAAAASSTDGFQLPGKKLSVLPIGLGVFAGISVIALIVVGLVTYERTKYRKAFRQRKLAESGASMGYGGTAA